MSHRVAIIRILFDQSIVLTSVRVCMNERMVFVNDNEALDWGKTTHSAGTPAIDSSAPLEKKKNAAQALDRRASVNHYQGRMSPRWVYDELAMKALPHQAGVEGLFCWAMAAPAVQIAQCRGFFHFRSTARCLRNRESHRGDQLSVI